MTKNKLIKTIVNCETGEVIEREYTSEEYIQYELDIKNYKLLLSDAQAKAEAKNALLERLGITEDEAKLLLA